MDLNGPKRRTLESDVPSLANSPRGGSCGGKKIYSFLLMGPPQLQIWIHPPLSENSDIRDLILVMLGVVWSASRST